MALAVLTAFTIGFAPGLAQAGINFSPIYEGHFQISGTVQESYPGYVLKSSKGTFHLAGADASKWVGQKVLLNSDHCCPNVIGIDSTGYRKRPPVLCSR